MKYLRKRHVLFCQHFVEHGNSTAAAEYAGYTTYLAKTGNRLIRNPAIIAEIARLRAEDARVAGISRQMILDGMMAEARNPKNSGAERTKAWENIAKMTGQLVERIEVTGYSVVAPHEKSIDDWASDSDGV